MAVNQSMNEAGILGLLVFPKFFFQTYAAAEKLVWKQINRIKEGDFSDEMFQSLKLEQKREYASKLEDINSRAEVMMRIFSQGKSWQDYLDEVTRIDALSREDVIEVSQEIFYGELYVRHEEDRTPIQKRSYPSRIIHRLYRRTPMLPPLMWNVWKRYPYKNWKPHFSILRKTPRSYPCVRLSRCIRLIIP